MTEYSLNSGKKIVEHCLKLNNDEIKKYIQVSLDEYIIYLNLNISKLEDRNKIYEFLNYQSMLFLNFEFNSELYLLGEKEVKKAELGRLVIIEIRESYRKNGFR